jgi:hypothetical protein
MSKQKVTLHKIKIDSNISVFGKSTSEVKIVDEHKEILQVKYEKDINEEQ